MTGTAQTRPDFLQSDILTHFGAYGEEDASQKSYQGLHAAMQGDIKDVEQLTGNVRCLLRDCNDVLESEGIRYQVETLERCMDYYRRGMLAAKIMTEFGDGWLQDMQDRLRKAVDEQHRWDAEGGNYLSEKGRTGMEPPIDRLTQAADRVQEALTAINAYFPKPAATVFPTSASQH